ncbi:unnamed protein product, partial [Allacma fusca]
VQLVFCSIPASFNVIALFPELHFLLINGASQNDMVGGCKGDEAGSEIISPASAADTGDVRGDIVSNGEDGTCSDKDRTKWKGSPTVISVGSIWMTVWTRRRRTVTRRSSTPQSMCNFYPSVFVWTRCPGMRT